ncbi:G protein-coupled receptor rhodopsin-like [Trinorchestia longiramus]|nr:G protein-coupled receptor rhodopsin-like [Trinorchestia longiramus]
MTASPRNPVSTLPLPSPDLPRMSQNSSFFSPLDFIFTPASTSDNSSSFNRTRSIITLAHSACPTSIPDSSFLLQNSNAPYLVSEILVALLAIIGNSLTILVFVKNRKLRRLTNYYIVSLAAADLLVGVLGIPFAILTSLGMPEAREPCLLMLCTLILLCTISIFSLVGVSVDRYWAILHPLIYARLMTASRARPCTDFGAACTDFGVACTDFGAVGTDFGAACTDFGAACTDFGEGCTDFEFSNIFEFGTS